MAILLDIDLSLLARGNSMKCHKFAVSNYRTCCGVFTRRQKNFLKFHPSNIMFRSFANQFVGVLIKEI